MSARPAGGPAATPTSYQRRGMKAARTILGSGADVRGFAAGRIETARMSTAAWWLIGIFGTLTAVILLTLHAVVVPGILVLALLYEFVKPKRAVVVTGTGVIEFRLRAFNAQPKAVLASTDHGVLYQGRARSVDRGIGLTFGSETIVVKDRDYAALLQSVPPVPTVIRAPDAAALPPPIPPPPPTVGERR